MQTFLNWIVYAKEKWIIAIMHLNLIVVKNQL